MLYMHVCVADICVGSFYFHIISHTYNKYLYILKLYHYHESRVTRLYQLIINRHRDERQNETSSGASERKPQDNHTAAHASGLTRSPMVFSRRAARRLS